VAAAALAVSAGSWAASAVDASQGFVASLASHSSAASNGARVLARRHVPNGPDLNSTERPSDARRGRSFTAAQLASAGAALGGLVALKRGAATNRRRVAAGVATVDEVDERVAVAAAEMEAADAPPIWRGLTVPMTRVEGLEDVKTALKLACIDPSLGGVGISGGHGTGKTTLARSLRGVLPKIEVVVNSTCNCDPGKPREWDKLTRQRMVRDAKGEVMTKVIDCPFVELPLGCTEDRLVGSLDVQASMEQGKPVFEPGLLAKAHRGVLYIDDVNLLQDDLVSLLLTAVESGVNRVEREGLSVAHPCRPLIVATWNPEEGPLRPHLLDRLAISLNTDVSTVYSDLDERAMACASAFDFAERPAESAEAAAADIARMQTQLLFAREFVNDVELSEEQYERLAQEASNGGCEGHRGEIFAVKIARAHAALNGRELANSEDLKEGIKLAIMPRIRIRSAASREEDEQLESPPPPPGEEEEEPPEDDQEESEPPPQEQEQEEQEEQQEPEEQEQPEVEEKDKGDDKEEDKDSDDKEEDNQEDQVPEEFMIDPEGVVLDKDLLKFQSQQKKSGRSGKGNKIYSMDRGRYVKAMLPKGGQAKNGRIALDATLRNAVVFQKMRRQDAIDKGTKTEDLRNVYIEKSDIWVKKMARKAGALVIFIVDASGSMALNRMQNAKGAVLRLLENAYQSRDQVALIPCRGISAEVLVPPTASVARASSSMQVLPCGGGTPLAHSLSQAMKLGTNAMAQSDVGQVCVVAITDGRANVPLAVSEGAETALDENGKMRKMPKEDLQEEAYLLADRLRGLGFKFLLIDTENKYVSSGVAKTLTDRAGGKYYYLPKADDKSIAAIAGDAVMEMKNK